MQVARDNIMHEITRMNVYIYVLLLAISLYTIYRHVSRALQLNLASTSIVSVTTNDDDDDDDDDDDSEIQLFPL